MATACCAQRRLATGRPARPISLSKQVDKSREQHKVDPFAFNSGSIYPAFDSDQGSHPSVRRRGDLDCPQQARLTLSPSRLRPHVQNAKKTVGGRDGPFGMFRGLRFSFPRRSGRSYLRI